MLRDLGSRGRTPTFHPGLLINLHLKNMDCNSI